MNIQQQNGIISTINFTPFLETEEYQNLRKSLFEKAEIASHISPINRTDVFDESILVFHTIQEALSFLYYVFRAVVNHEMQANDSLSLRSSLCYGDYFMHQDQIYGEAVNLATKLSYSSRANEMTVCGIDSEIIEEFTKLYSDIACSTRNCDDKNCVSIRLLDQDSTSVNVAVQKFQFDFNDQSKSFELARNVKVNIGRSTDSDIFIDSDLISRNHATVTLSDESIFIEDHSSNGTYLYFDDREIYLTKDSIELSNSGHISCGFSLYSQSDSSDDIISYRLEEEGSTV